MAVKREKNLIMLERCKDRTNFVGKTIVYEPISSKLRLLICVGKDVRQEMDGGRMILHRSSLLGLNILYNIWREGAILVQRIKMLQRQHFRKYKET